MDGASNEQFGQVVAATDGLERLIHTTASHSAESVCVRVILPLKESVLAEEWRAARAAFVESKRLKGLIDDRQDPARFYYVPTRLTDEAEHDFWESPGELLDLLSLPRAGRTEKHAFPDGARIDLGDLDAIDLGPLRECLKRGVWGRRLLKGEPLASVGGRHDAILAAANEVSKLLPDDVPDEVIQELFAESFAAMDALNPEDAPVADWADLPNALATSRPWWAERRAQFRSASERLARRARETARMPGEEKHAFSGATREGEAAEKHAFSEVPPEDPEPGIYDAEGFYTEEALERWSREQGCAGDLDAFQHRWIISKDGAHYLFSAGSYQPAVSDQDVEARVQVVLSPAPVELTVPTKEGMAKPRGLKELRRAYGTSPLRIRGSLALRKSKYDAREDTFVEALAPLRNLEPKEHPEIGEWLVRLAGPADRAALLDWIATCPEVERGTSALYMAGPPGCGKSMLAQGLGRLWSLSGYTPFENFASGFNSMVAECPLVFADEQLPDLPNVTATIRQMLGNSTFELRRKFLPSVSVEGYPRLVIAANDDKLFERLRGQDLNSASVEAVAERILVVEALAAAKEYLKELSHSEKASWAFTGDKIAEHCLWLQKTRKVDRTGRFLVPGKMSEMVKRLSISHYASAVLQTVARCLDLGTSPSVQKWLRVQFGRVEVKSELFGDKGLWEKAVGVEYKMSATRTAEALREHLSVGRVEGWWVLKGELLELWMERNGVGDLEGLRKRLGATGV